jgi:hypothetical protein
VKDLQNGQLSVTDPAPAGTIFARPRFKHLEATVGHELRRRRPAERQPDVGPYAVLYPGITQRLDPSSYQAVSGGSAIVLETIPLPIEDPAHMPVICDLSATRRGIINALIVNGRSEGGSDA